MKEADRTLYGGIDGLVHLSDISWDKPDEEAASGYKKGDLIKAKVLDVSVEKERISLGIKQLSEDPFESLVNNFKKGDTITCTIAGVKDSGIDVTIPSGLSTFIRRSDLSRDKAEQRPERFAAGDKLDAKIISIDTTARRVGLSIKALEVAEEKEAMVQYGSSDSGASLGDILGAALKKNEDGSESEDKS